MSKKPAAKPKIGRPPSASSKGMPVSLRLRPDVKAAAIKASIAEGVSLSGLLEGLLTTHLRAKELLPATADNLKGGS